MATDAPTSHATADDNAHSGAARAGAAAALRRIRTRLAEPLAAPIHDPALRRWLWFELIVVLCATFGLAGYTSILSLIQSALDAAPLNQQTQTLNDSASSLGWLDLAYQLGRIVRLLAWAALPLVLLWHSGVSPAAIGADRRRPGTDLLRGAGLAALIGIPGLALYLGSLALGANLHVAASGLTETWWRVPVLLGAAGANALAEELLVGCYLLVRLRQLGVPVWATVLGAALLRGSYHLYQGFGGGLGNLAMGLICALFFLRYRRIWPLVIAHFLLDTCAFLGYALLSPHLSWL